MNKVIKLIMLISIGHTNSRQKCSKSTKKKKSVFKELVIGCYDTGTAARDSSGSDPRRDTGSDQVPCAAQLEHQCSEGGSMRRRTR